VADLSKENPSIFKLLIIKILHYIALKLFNKNLAKLKLMKIRINLNPGTFS